MARMAAMLANQVLQLRYGRADESESDAFGIVTLADAGYDPRAMLNVMRVLTRARGSIRRSSCRRTRCRRPASSRSTRRSGNGGRTAVPSTLGRGRRLGG